MMLGVMQPYLFPYLGYHQLANLVDVFVLYDDVTYIKGGWINRNCILVNNKPFLFTLPLQNASSNVLIRDIRVGGNVEAWRKRFLKTIRTAYARAPYFEAVDELIQRVVVRESSWLRDWLIAAHRETFRYLRMETRLVESSSVYDNACLKRVERLMDICQREGANCYINAIGGVDLYAKAEFDGAGIQLRFLESLCPEYPQFGRSFVPNLSIIDIMMFNAPHHVASLLKAYRLV